MEYKTDVRTKNLTLRDIHVGDWVQVWNELTECYFPPMKIIQISEDGTIYLVRSNVDRISPWIKDIRDVDALPITADLLKEFGFKFGSSTNFYVRGPVRELRGIKRKVFHGDTFIGWLYECGDGNVKFTVEGRCKYMHELCDKLSRKFNFIKLEWKGAEK